MLVADAGLRECFLETLASAASNHPSAMSRKSALQALIRFATCWIPTREDVLNNGADPEGPVPGFRNFAAQRVAKVSLFNSRMGNLYDVVFCSQEACVDAVMRGDLDPRDAGCAAAVAECVNFLRVLLERLGDEFGDHLRVNLLGSGVGVGP